MATEKFPSLADQGMVSVDVETCDPDLKARGPGWHRDDGFIAGVAVGTEAGFRRYYPVAHAAGENLDKAKVFGWLKAELSDPKVPKVFANAIYDIGFLAAAGVPVAGKLFDIQLAEPLIDETRNSYSLEALAQTYFGEGKVDAALEQHITGHLRDEKGRRYNSRNWKSAIWRAPADAVEPYAIGDIDLPLRIFARQRKELERLDLWSLFELEISLLPMLLAMRQRGVAIDLPYAEKLYKRLSRRQARMYRTIRDAAGMDFELWNAGDVGRVFDALGIDYPKTSITKAPSFTKEWLAHHPDPTARALRDLRHLDKLKNTFVKGAIINGAYEGRIYCSFNQLRSGSFGTVSGRFSSSKPNLQQIPVRGDDGRAIRACFIPDEGMDFAVFDWSQIEFRLLVNDAYHFGPRGAEEVVEIYRNDPRGTDYHRVVAEMTGLERAAAKTVNFGLAYGTGVATLCANLGLSEAEGTRLLNEYHRRLPFMRGLMDHWARVAERKRELRTALGRLRRFNKWELRRAGKRVQVPARVPGARLVTFTALNARIQGSAADVMKAAMADIWHSGVCSVLGAPHLTVHDELSFSAPRTKAGREALAEVKRIMESVIDIDVQLTVDHKTGPNWGACKE
jgi:DNA polymerase I-like protein with 3'-5' exonuclease and polymerase domains